jgi:hypothetical protein
MIVGYCPSTEGWLWFLITLPLEKASLIHMVVGGIGGGGGTGGGLHLPI